MKGTYLYGSVQCDRSAVAEDAGPTHWGAGDVGDITLVNNVSLTEGGAGREDCEGSTTDGREGRHDDVRWFVFLRELVFTAVDVIAEDVIRCCGKK